MPKCYGSGTSKVAQEQAETRHQRLLKRREAEQKRECEKVLEIHRKVHEDEEASRWRLEAAASLVEFSQQEFTKQQATQTDAIIEKDISTSCVEVDDTTDDMMEDVMKENQQLKKKMKRCLFRAAMIEGDDSLTQQYTGLPTYGVFLHIIMFLSLFTKSSRQSLLSIEDEIFLTLVRLRLALFLGDLANRFDISVSSVSRIFQKWLDIMYSKLSFLITWPSRDTIHQNMPPAFKTLYPNCCCIIDCSEVFIEMPASFSARAQTYSDYKKHNTIKYLIGITPCGSISFLSKCWGGRVSDKQLTQESNFFSLLEPGDASQELCLHNLPRYRDQYFSRR